MHAARRWSIVLRAVCVVLPALLAGCGAAFGGAVAGFLSGGDGTTTRTATTVAVRRIDKPQTGRVAIPISVTADSGETIVLENVQFSMNGVDFFDATEALGFPSAERPGSVWPDRSGHELAYVWNSHYDLDTLRREEMNRDPMRATSIPVSARAIVRVSLRNRSTGKLFTRDTGEFLLHHGLVATVAGGGVGDGPDVLGAAMFAPSSVAVDQDGRVFVADTKNQRVRVIESDAGTRTLIIRTTVGNGFQGFAPGLQDADATSLENPVDIVVDSGGNLYIAEQVESESEGGRNRGRIRFVDAKTNLITTFSEASESPVDLALDEDGVLYVADDERRDVFRAIPGAGALLPLLPSHPFTRPLSIATASGRVWIADERDDGTLIRLVVDGVLDESMVLGSGARRFEIGDARDVGRFSGVTSIAATDELLAVSDGADRRVIIFRVPSLIVVNVFENDAFARPAGVAFGERGELFVCDRGDGAVGHTVLFTEAPTDPSSGLANFAASDSLKGRSQALAQTMATETPLGLSGNG